MTEERKETFEEEKQNQKIDEEPLSRMSRNAGRHQKQKKKEKQRRPAAPFTEKVGTVWAAVKRYCRFALRILQSPVKIVEEDEFSRFKYALISMLVFSIFFSIGNWFQLRASQQRTLGFGERHHTFFDGFTVVLVYSLVFLAAAAGAVWLVSRYMMKQKITMRDAAAGFGSLLVPAVACSIVWMIFAILNLPVITVIFTALTLFLVVSAIVQFVQILYKTAERASVDVMYCILAAAFIMLVFTALTWPLVSEYFTASLIPL
ncbi:hypothetical protein J7E26_01125 [Bacillus sp. ISL-51]|uniref:hypothetical protein n=1 Tax=Bacteria TaxID=2 RepID=UPI001BE67F0E|nr:MULTISPECIES: hypothetical protein [Bacteria]MBT2572568.1 hypothetical protein [Bacillus sp. ISL-51]MBT2634502.1 hypothetical protein [Bacillus sp. ISL-26]MBT2711636.1 hypothetical protein [Pseudomonas sp. ISL-88]